MAQLNALELQNLRHFIGNTDLAAAKYQTYAQQSNDTQLKAHFQQEASKAQQSAQKLRSFLA